MCVKAARAAHSLALVGAACSRDQKVGAACSRDQKVGAACSRDQKVGAACSRASPRRQPALQNEPTGGSDERSAIMSTQRDKTLYRPHLADRRMLIAESSLAPNEPKPPSNSLHHRELDARMALGRVRARGPLGRRGLQPRSGEPRGLSPWSPTKAGVRVPDHRPRNCGSV